MYQWDYLPQTKLSMAVILNSVILLSMAVILYSLILIQVKFEKLMLVKTHIGEQLHWNKSSSKKKRGFKNRLNLWKQQASR